MIHWIRKHGEHFIYATQWLLLFIIPVIIEYSRSVRLAEFSFQWSEVLRVWLATAFLLVGMIIHNYFIAPILVYQKKGKRYLLLAALLIAAFWGVQILQRPTNIDEENRVKARVEMMKKEAIAKGEPVRETLEKPKYGGPPGVPPLVFGQQDVVQIVLFILLMGVNLGIKFYFKSERDELDYEELKNKTLEHQIEYLKYQINPHFFMNTLNNIHALIDISPERAKTAMMQLSKMMRYVLYDTDKRVVPVKEGLNFMQNFIQLMRLRYTDKVKINVNIPNEIPDRTLPPMLIISFIENAFKHGVSYKKPSFINIDFQFAKDGLHFQCVNSKQDEIPKIKGGVGLKNTRERLTLLYPDHDVDDLLEITENNETYNVKLFLPWKTT